MQLGFAVIALAIAPGVLAQTPAAPPGQRQARYVPEEHRPPLFFREDWKHVPADTPEHPVTQASLSSPNLELRLYGEIRQGTNPDTGIWEIQ